MNGMTVKLIVGRNSHNYQTIQIKFQKQQISFSFFFILFLIKKNFLMKDAGVRDVTLW